MEKDDIAKFYDLKGGENLINTENYPEEIKDYLIQEKRIILEILSRKNYSGILEIGCMNGREIDISSSLGIKYIGIDIVERFIEDANKKISEEGINGFATVCDIKDLSTISIHLSSTYLGVFPFNSFGNIDLPQNALSSLSEYGLDALILTYKTNKKTNDIRKTYLDLSQLSGIRMEKNMLGIVFTSDEGLCSYAYFPQVVTHWAEEVGYKKIRYLDISDIGKGYYLEKK